MPAERQRPWCAQPPRMRGKQPLPRGEPRNRWAHPRHPFRVATPGRWPAGWLVILPERFYARCMARKSWVLTIVVSGAGAASDVGTLVKEALARGWVVQVVATPSALAFFDVNAIEALTGSPVRSVHRSPGEPRSRIPDAIVVAPATFNLLNQWALGVADSYPPAVLAGDTGAACARSVRARRAEGVSVLLGPGGSAPSGAADDDFPWQLALDEAAEMTGFG